MFKSFVISFLGGRGAGKVSDEGSLKIKDPTYTMTSPSLPPSYTIHSPSLDSP